MAEPAVLLPLSPGPSHHEWSRVATLHCFHKRFRDRCRRRVKEDRRTLPILRHAYSWNSVHMAISNTGLECASTVLIDKGEFNERPSANRDSLELQVVPRVVRFGRADERQASGRLLVQFDSTTGWNRPLELPHRDARELLWYEIDWEVLQPAGGVHELLRSPRTSLRAGTPGRWMRVPLLCSAAFPWRPADFVLRCDGHAQPAWTCGRAARVYWGFTPLCALEPQPVAEELAWFDQLGRAGHAGSADVVLRHSGRFMGPFANTELWVRVPQGHALLYRVHYQQFDGRECRATLDTISHLVLPPPAPLRATAPVDEDGAR